MGNQSTLTQQEVKVPIIDFKRGDRILLDNGTVAIVTGYKTKQNVQVKDIATDSFTWTSIVEKVYRAK